MIDTKIYLEKKAKGLLVLKKIGDAYATAVKRFDPETGVGLSDEISALSIKEVDEAIAQKVAELANLKALKADLVATV